MNAEKFGNGCGPEGGFGCGEVVAFQNAGLSIGEVQKPELAVVGDEAKAEVGEIGANLFGAGEGDKRVGGRLYLDDATLGALIR